MGQKYENMCYFALLFREKPIFRATRTPHRPPHGAFVRWSSTFGHGAYCRHFGRHQRRGDDPLAGGGLRFQARDCGQYVGLLGPCGRDRCARTASCGCRADSCDRIARFASAGRGGCGAPATLCASRRCGAHLRGGRRSPAEGRWCRVRLVASKGVARGGRTAPCGRLDPHEGSPALETPGRALGGGAGRPHRTALCRAR